MAEFKTACGATLLVDEDLIEKFSRHTWRLSKQGYAYRKTDVNGIPGSMVFMHRDMLGAQRGQIVDHIDRNPLNNQRSNLRFVTPAQSSINTGKTRGGSSQFKGVHWSKSSAKWHAGIGFQGKRIHIGSFDCEHEAGHAYNKAAVFYYGEYATLNPVGFEATNKEK